MTSACVERGDEARSLCAGSRVEGLIRRRGEIGSDGRVNLGVESFL